MKNIIPLITIALSFLSFTIIQNIISHKISDDFLITIKGTSNLHDWVSTVEKVEGIASISYSENGDIRIDDCKITFPVKSIKSSKGSIMDKKTWKALKEKKYPTINYQLTSFENVIKTGKRFTAYAKGDLEIGTTTKSIYMKIYGTELKSGDLEISGSKKLKMTDFNIGPPTALMGALTTGDEVTAEFRIILKK